MVVDEPFRVTVRAPEALHAGLSPAAADRVASALSGVLDELGASHPTAVSLAVGSRIELEAGGHVCGCSDELVTRARAYVLGSAALGGDDNELSPEASDELLELVCGTLLAEHPGLHRPLPPTPEPDAIELLVEPGYLRELSRIDAMAENFSFMRDGLFMELGLPVPPILLVPDDTLRLRAFAARIGHKRTIPLIGLPDGALLVNDTTEHLVLMALGGTYESCINPATWQVGTLARGADAPALEAVGLTTWDHAGYVILAVADMIRRNAHLLLTADALEASLETFKQAFPALGEGLNGRSEELLPALQTLLADQVSIRDMYRISERVLHHEALQEEEPGLPVVSAVRRGLMGAIAHKFTRGTGTLVAYIVDPALEREVEEAAADPRWPYTDLGHELGAVLAQEMGHLPPTAQVPVILTRDDIRVALRDALRVRQPRISVVGYGDLPEYCNVQPVARLAR
jgi:type III secretory pathway component EscV